MTYPQLPDAEAALIAFLTAHATLAPLHGGRVATELRTTAEQGVCLQVTALGGPQSWPWESTPEFGLSSWGGSKAEAAALDRAVRAVVFELLGAAFGGGRVTGVGIRLAGLWSPADDTARARYRSDIALTVMP